jgi:hypothetical protein
LSRDEGKELLAHILSGVCGGHIGARALAEKSSGRVFIGPP